MKTMRLFYATLSSVFLLIVLSACSGGGGSEGGNGSPGSLNKLSENTIVIDQDTSMRLVSQENDILTYSYTGSTPSNVQPGKILLSGEGNGYLRKVISAQPINNVLVVKTEQASLAEAFDELHIDTTINMNGNIAQNTDGVMSNRIAASIGSGGSVSIGLGGYKFGGSQDYDMSISAGDFKITPSLDTKIDISKGLNDFKLVLRGNILYNLSVDIKTSTAVTITPDEKALLPAPIQIFAATIPVPVGPIIVPVPIIGDFTANIGLTLSAAGASNAKLGFTSISDIAGGFQSGNPMIYEFAGTITPTMTIDKAIALSVKTYIRPKVSLKICGAVGPYFDLRPYGKGSAIIDSAPHFEGGLGVSGNIGGEVTILSKNLAAINYELFDIYYPIWTSPINLPQPPAPSGDWSFTSEYTYSSCGYGSPFTFGNCRSTGRSMECDVVITEKDTNTFTFTISTGLTDDFTGTISGNNVIINEANRVAPLRTIAIYTGTINQSSTHMSGTFHSTSEVKSCIYEGNWEASRR